MHLQGVHELAVSHFTEAKPVVSLAVPDVVGTGMSS